MPYLSRRLSPCLLTAALALGPALPSFAETGKSGAYLAARQAETLRDFPASAEWFARALTAAPDDQRLLQGLLQAQIALGAFGEAALPAEALMKDGQGTPSARLALSALRSASGDFAGVRQLLSARDPATDPVEGLILGWAEVGLGQMGESLAHFDRLIAAPGLEPIGHYQKALALAFAGDLEGADAILSGPAAPAIASFRRGLVAHIQILSQLERNADALKLLDKGFGDQLAPDLADLRRRLAAGEPVPFDIVTRPAEGMAEALFTYAAGTLDQAEPEVTLAYARAALHLRPGDTDITLMIAQTYDALGQSALAAQTYAMIGAEDPARHLAEIGRAEALRDGGDAEAGIAVLQALTQSHPDLVQVRLALGDMLRRLDRYEDALTAYDAGIALVSGPAPWSWPLHFNRGVCLERLNRFDEAVPAFRKALALNPGQPQVLNYLGYTWIDRGENLTEAVQMIEAAVKGAPDQGYIIDSLAWAYYRLGRFADALAPMERASLLEPVDPIVTDHLGDVYWVNNRKTEARFQWRRALSFEPTEKDAERIRAKLELGLDAVLDQEKAGDGTSN